jgi:hypothetical protein
MMMNGEPQRTIDGHRAQRSTAQTGDVERTRERTVRFRGRIAGETERRRHSGGANVGTTRSAARNEQSDQVRHRGSGREDPARR